jgi:Flp pilus assembly protein TadD
MRFFPFAYRLLLTSCCAISMMGCATTTTPAPKTAPEAVTEQTLKNTVYSLTNAKYTEEKVELLKTAYEADTANLASSIRYAHALRSQKKYKQAKDILLPHYNAENPSPVIQAQYAAILLDMKAYKGAEKAVNKAIAQDPTDPYAYNLLGNILSTQELHDKAERAYRTALDHWSGNKVPVLNNLALSLMGQGKFDDAAHTLEQAKEIDPDSYDIERNLRIVNALRETEYEIKSKKEKLKAAREKNAPPPPGMKPIL